MNKFILKMLRAEASRIDNSANFDHEMIVFMTAVRKIYPNVPPFNVILRSR